MIQRRRRKKKENYGRRAFSGYVEFRHGDRRPVYAPGRNPEAKFKGPDREHLIEAIGGHLGKWQSSPFEFEGACRAGARAALCLAGDRWEEADQEAASLVEEALRKSGARRPTWEQGQREYTEPEGQCLWCGGEVPSEMRTSRYCSEHCAKMARQRRDFADRTLQDNSYASVAYALDRARSKTRACQSCGGAFKSRDPDAVFCSLQCSVDFNSQPTQANECQLCGKPYLSVYTHAGFCSQTCRAKSAMMTSGQWKPKRLSPVVFDFYLTRPVNSRPPWITPERFDDLVRLAA